MFKSKIIVVAIFTLLLAIALSKAILDLNPFYFLLAMMPILFYFSTEKPYIFPFGLYVFLLPFDSILNITGQSNFGTVTFFLGFLSIVVMAVECMYKNNLRPYNKISVWWIFFMLYGALSIFWAIQPDLVLRRLPTAVGLLLLYLVISSYPFKKSEYVYIKYFVIYGGFCAALYAVFSYQSDIFYYGTGRVSLLLGERRTDPNQFGFSLILPISLCIQQIITRSKFDLKLLFFSFVLVVLIYGLVLSGSRGCTLGVAIIFLIYIFLSNWKEIRFLSILSIGILIILYFITPIYLIERLSNMFESGGAGRIEIWTASFYKGIDMYGIFGSGLNNYPEAYDRFIGYIPLKPGRGSHNIFVGTLLELGSIGFILLIIVAIKHYNIIRTKLIQNERCDSIMLQAAFWGTLISSFFLDTMWRKSFWLLWMLILIKYHIIQDEMLTSDNSNPIRL